MMKKHLPKPDSNLWLVLALSIFAWAPLLTPAYFFDAHDAKHSVFFLVEFDQTFRDGYLWPRWSPDFAFGYGYPLFNLYAPLTFYAAEMFHLLGLGFTTAIKTMYVLATMAAGLGMYLFVRRLYGPMAGLLAAVVYMYVPFHLVEIFVRSAYAEFVALAIIPFLFWAFTELIAAPTLRRIALAGLFYGLLALTHHTSFFTFTPFLIVYLLYLILTNYQLPITNAFSGTPQLPITNYQNLISPTLYTLAAGLLGVMLAGIYLIPLLTETRYIKVEQWTSGSYNYLQHFVYFSQFFSEKWGYGYAGPGVLDDFSYQLGIVSVSLISFALVVILFQPFPHRATAFFFLIATGLAILLMSPLAEPIWQILPIASLVQFPWRLLAMTAFTMSIVAGALVAGLEASDILRERRTRDEDQDEALASENSDDPDRSSPQPQARQLSCFHHMPHVMLLALVVILASFSYTLPQYTEIPAWAEKPLAVINWDRASIVDRVGMVSVTEEQPQTSPMEQQYLNNEPLVTAGLIAGRGVVEMLRHGGVSDKVKVIAAEPVTLQFYTYDYPGWQVTLNGRPVPHRPEPPYGLITVEVPAGEHIVQLRMGSTPPRLIGTAMSGFAVLIIFGLTITWPSLKLTIRRGQFIITGCC
jgi:hypothetical protein